MESAMAAAENIIAGVGTSTQYVVPAILIFGGVALLLSVLNFLDLMSFFYFVSFKLPYNLSEFLKLIIIVINQPLFALGFSTRADYTFLSEKL